MTKYRNNRKKSREQQSLQQISSESKVYQYKHRKSYQVKCTNYLLLHREKYKLMNMIFRHLALQSNNLQAWLTHYLKKVLLAMLTMEFASSQPIRKTFSFQSSSTPKDTKRNKRMPSTLVYSSKCSQRLCSSNSHCETLLEALKTSISACKKCY